MKRLALIVATLLCLLAPASAFAAAPYDPLGDACSSGGGVNGVQGASACSATTKNTVTGPNGVLKKVSLIMAVISGVVAVIIILLSGFRYITSAGDAQKAASARSAIVGAVVGLVVIAASESIIVFVVSKI